MIKHYTLENFDLHENALEAQLFLPADLVYFDGHFDEMPILPGIAQTHWAIELAKKHLNIQGEFSSVDNIKFTRIIEPEQSVNLKVTYDSVKNFLEFSYVSERGPHSSGKIRFS